MIDMHQDEIDGIEIATLGAFKPWGLHKDEGGDGASYPEHSGRILDVKSGQEAGLHYFIDFMAPRIRTPGVIAIVPSSDPTKTGPGIRKLAKRLAGLTPLYDATAALIRHTKIARLAPGVRRDIRVHLDSIAVKSPQLIVGERVFLLDDVLSSGNSMLACRRLLEDAGASDVICMALGRIAD
ncbi:phosphoribosyltransferase [Sphingomonas crusticola]|uniref:phosphoribosyltransferase n=1 Tax=Sphingomonas crusticola TaxID=1697973 RepID=UPI0013C32C87|nr:phosphoribosyltransferase [Sphingomonas crusticola]